jgi:hypothetical protein
MDDRDLERSMGNPGDQGYPFHKSHFAAEKNFDHSDGGQNNYSASKPHNESMFRNNVTPGGREFGGHRPPRSQHSVESRERGQVGGDERILRANEVLLLSAKKENTLLNNLKIELDEKK